MSSPIRCFNCGGTGLIITRNSFGEPMNIHCPDCYGKGICYDGTKEYFDRPSRCIVCGGTGFKVFPDGYGGTTKTFCRDCGGTGFRR